MDFNIEFSIDFDFIKEIRKKWNPYWETSKCVLWSNAFISNCNLEETELKKDGRRTYYDVRAEGDKIIETITCGNNYILLTTEAEQAEEIVFKIHRNFGMLHQESIETQDVENLIDKVMVKSLQDKYPYEISTGRACSCGGGMIFFSILIETEKHS